MSIETDVSEGGESSSVLPESFRSFVDELRDRASVETVYGEPIESHGKTVIPVARIAYGVGGGLGSGSEGQGEGAGGGGGLTASPVGALEVTDGETRFVRFADRRRLGGALLAGLVLGLLLGRRRS